jgi:hypothetical protein
VTIGYLQLMAPAYRRYDPVCDERSKQSHESTIDNILLFRRYIGACGRCQSRGFGVESRNLYVVNDRQSTAY